jgi:hypothetical protein
MSCKSAIYTVNNTVNAVALNGNIPLGTTLRRFGQNLEQSGNGILVCGDGYYDIGCSITLSPSTVGTVTVSILQDGVAIAGATASANVATANTPINLNLKSMLRLRCCDDTSTLTLLLSGVNAAINNVALTVEKL